MLKNGLRYLRFLPATKPNLLLTNTTRTRLNAYFKSDLLKKLQLLFTELMNWLKHLRLPKNYSLTSQRRRKAWPLKILKAWKAL